PHDPELRLDSAELDHTPLASLYLEATVGHALSAAEFARLLAGDEFHRALRRALYERPALADYRPTEVHSALAALAAAMTPACPCIHTTNYDDLLDRALAAVTRAPTAAVHAARRRAPDGPRVVHLAGYFPYAPREGEDERQLARTLLCGEPDDDLLTTGAA